MSRGLIILLVVSLGLNVFALGHLSGRMLAGERAPPPQAMPMEPRRGFDDPFRLMRHAEQLSPESREEFRTAFREQLPALRAEHRRMRALRRELGELMRAEDWDGAAVSAKLEEIRAAQMRQQEAFNAAFLAAFEGLSAEERRQLIEAGQERRLDRRQRWRERREGLRGEE